MHHIILGNYNTEVCFLNVGKNEKVSQYMYGKVIKLCIHTQLSVY